MKLGSLASGVGGLDLAVEGVFGAELAWYAEIDKDASKVMDRHWPGVPNLGDIRDLSHEDYVEYLEPVDIICAGPPCQPVSQAGRRKGDSDDRWLWPAVLDVVAGLRPRWVVFENPPGIAPWLPAIIYRLAQLGYVGQAGLWSAASVGACHRRERWFIVAHPHGQPEWQDTGKPPAGQEPGRWHQPANNRHPVPVAHANGQGLGISGPLWPRRDSALTQEWVGLDGLGESVLAQMPDGSTRDYGPALRNHAAVLGRPWPNPLKGRTLNGDFSEWMMMLPEGWLEGVSNTAKKRLAGNSVVPLQAMAAILELR
jgi:DNA (cytosine-5)-methyltransferase 1